MDNIELYSEIRKLDSEVSRLRWAISEKIWPIWWVMCWGFYFFALFGLYLIHQAYVDSVHEMRREIAAMQPTVQPKVHFGATPGN